MRNDLAILGPHVAKWTSRRRFSKGLGLSESDIRKACPGAGVLAGLAIHGGSVNGAEREIRLWVHDTGLTFGPAS
jgi:hypothetical protein